MPTFGAASGEQRHDQQPTHGRMGPGLRLNGTLGTTAGLFWHTDIYERRNERWQAVWSWATRIPEQI